MFGFCQAWRVHPENGIIWESGLTPNLFWQTAWIGIFHNFMEIYGGTQHCEIRDCNGEVFSSCVRCNILLCYEHFITDSVACLNHITEEANVIPGPNSLNTYKPDNIDGKTACNFCGLSFTRIKSHITKSHSVLKTHGSLSSSVAESDDSLECINSSHEGSYPSVKCHLCIDPKWIKNSHGLKTHISRIHHTQQDSLRLEAVNT